MYTKKLEDALKTLRGMKSSTEEDAHLTNETIYKRVYGILDEHIGNELTDEQRIGKLVMALRDYKKHLEFAKIVLDKDFKTQEQDDRVPRRQPDFQRDMADTERQIIYAMKEWEKVKTIVAELMDAGSLR